MSGKVILREIDYVANGWAKITYVDTYAAYNEAVAWCRINAGDDVQVIGRSRFYFKDIRMAEFFILRFL